MRIAGVDEAGRGCLIGPLVVAGIVLEKEVIPKLCDLGVRDSKKLTPKRREEIADLIKDLAIDVSYFELQPRSIDLIVLRNVKLRKLNYVEAMAMAKVIRELKPDEAYVDACDVNAVRFGKIIAKVLGHELKIVSEHKADSTYIVVSAASILAKVRRDTIISELRDRYGDFNSGYPSDEKTITWLEEWLHNNDECPDCVRLSWKPVKKTRERIKGV
jgi:ribonuclease HII